METEDYGWLCSQLTLQSDKRGFFLEFASNVADTAGPAWLQQFASLTTDRSKIQFCFSTPRVAEEIDSILSHVEPLNRNKSAWLSRMRRDDAHQALNKGSHQRALLLINQAVVRASKPGADMDVDNGLSLPLSLWVRSEILKAQDNWQRALEDVQLALKYQLPPPLKNQAYLKMCECYLRMGQTDKARLSIDVWKRLGGDSSVLSQSDADTLREMESACVASSDANTKSKIPRPIAANQKTPDNNKSETELSGGCHKVYKGCSSMLEVRTRAGAGREMVAGARLPVGTVVAREQPYAACLLTDKQGSNCLNCLKRLEVVVCCDECSGIAYCSSQCAAQGQMYHRYECKHLDLLIGSGMSVLCFLALRMVTQNSVKYFQEIYPRLEDSNFHHPYAHIWRLEGHSDKRDAKSYLHRTLMAIFLVYILRQTAYFSKNSVKTGTLSADELLIAEVLLKHLQVLQYNAHEIYETLAKSRSTVKQTKTVYIGVAVYPSASLFNHSCQPTVARYFEGKGIVLRTVRPLNKGEVVAENYGPVYTMRTKEQRQKSLLARYLFKCICEACEEDWPKLDDMTDDLPVYIRCSGRNCTRTFLYSAKAEFGKTRCEACKTETDVKERRLLLCSLCHDFESAVAHMDAGEAELAQAVLTAFVERAYQIVSAPNRSIALAQEALRSCWASKSNMVYTS